MVSAKEITLYDGFRRPTPEGDAEASRLRTFRHIASQLKELNLFAGRIAMETGQFWHHASAVRSTERVDDQLLLDLGRLEDNLLAQQLPRDQAQALIGRTVFCQYLIDRNIIDATRLSKICGARTLATALRDQNSVERLFRWLRLTFNGDMFGESGLSANLSTDHYKTVSHFLDGVNPDTGQLKLFPYQFDIIPVKLVSSIYERFAKSDKLGASSGIHFTRLPLVSFILDEVLDRLNGRETVLDLTCGSGVFLVEALRRLVRRKSPDGQPSRQLVRTTLYEQIYGVDLSESAIRVASFSLYLAVAGT